MLKEGWDVRNVTTIVGLRAYSAKSNILPEQTLGRGLRRMYFGTRAARDRFRHGDARLHGFRRVHPERRRDLRARSHGRRAEASAQDSLVVEVDTENPDKDIDALDIALPRLTRRFNREFKDLAELDPAAFGNPKLPVKPSRRKQTREIVFKTMLDSGARSHHPCSMAAGRADYRSVVAFFARQLLKDLRLVGGYDLLYPEGQGLHARPSVRPRRSTWMTRSFCATCPSPRSANCSSTIPRRDQRADHP